ncbi:MAG: hypothetical protein ACFBWO_12455 [Paracoccaceae bacterium]
MPFPLPTVARFPPRCPVCAGRRAEALAFGGGGVPGWRRCAYCGFALRHCTAPRAGWRAFASRLVPGPVRLPPFGAADWFADAPALAIAATRAGLAFLPAEGRPTGHAPRAPHGRLVPLGRFAPRPVTLVTLARAVAAHRLGPPDPSFAAGLLLVDADAVPDGLAPGWRALARPLSGDFAAQRDAAQDAAGTEWVFHLDADEGLSPGLAARLPRLAAVADALGYDAVGLARENRVDGVPSDLFPDLQYRLVRRSARFVGHVHERPDACADWTRTLIALDGRIVHRLSAARIAAREAAYRALGQEAARSADARRLLAPYRP